MPRPTPTRVHAGSAGTPRIPTGWEANRLCARPFPWRCWVPWSYWGAASGRRSVTVCCRSASRRRSTVACCAGKRIAVNSSSTRPQRAARAPRGRASLRCNLRRPFGGPVRAAVGVLRRACNVAAARAGALASAASGVPVSRGQRHAVARRAPVRAAVRAIQGRRADSRRPRCRQNICRRDIWWRIG